MKISTSTSTLILVLVLIHPAFSSNSLLKKADMALKGGKYCEAYVYYKAAAKMDASLQKRKEFRQKHNKAYSMCLYSKGLEYLENNNLEKAYTYFKQSHELNPPTPEVKEKLEWTKGEISKKLCRKGREMMERDSADTRLMRQALDIFHQALKLDQNNSTAREYIETAKNKLNSLKDSAEDMFQQGMILFNSNKIQEATRQFERIFALHPGFQPVKEKLANIYLLNAYRFEKEKKWANALVEYLGVLRVTAQGSSSSPVESLRMIYNRLLREMKRQIAVDFYDSRAKKLLADKTYSLFFDREVKIDFLSLSEFEKLQDILALHKTLLNQNKVYQENPDDKIKELSYVISVRVEDFAVISKPAHWEDKVHKYILSIEKIFNRKWGQVKRKLEQLKAKHQQELNANQGLAAMGTFYKIAAAEAELNRLEKYHEKVTYGNHPYKVYTYWKKGHIRIKYVIKDIQASVTVKEDELREEIISTDTMIDNLFPGLPQDPLELLSDFEIKEKLTAAIARRLLETTADELARYLGRIYFNSTETHKHSGDHQCIVEGYVKFLLVNRKTWNREHEQAAQYLKEYKLLSWDPNYIFPLLETTADTSKKEPADTSNQGI